MYISWVWRFCQGLGIEKISRFQIFDWGIIDSRLVWSWQSSFILFGNLYHLETISASFCDAVAAVKGRSPILQHIT
ncbi:MULTISPECIES: hypothetical protein [unclassified Microcoleus]|uniref:hypothetical protein n=1 Tax=unclassified Microcoleus TaxID=2642155 RepID=UPI002FCF2692